MPAPTPAAGDRPLTALPSPRARALAFSAILLAGLCGALIGWSFIDLQCSGNCTTPSGIGAIVGALMAASGVAVVAVLTLRAMSEWKRVNEDELYADGGTAPAQPPSTSRRNPSA